MMKHLRVWYILALSLLQGWRAIAFCLPQRLFETRSREAHHVMSSASASSTWLLPTHRRQERPHQLRMSTEAEEDEQLGLQKIKVGDKDFWMRQKQLVQEMQDASESNLRAEMREKFAQRRLALVGDTAYFGFFIFCILWTFSTNPFVAISYAFGATMGLAYAYGLGRYVETIGGRVDDEGTVQGAGLGQARFAFLILLLVFVGKFRSVGLLEIPSIGGFFTYQLASLSQGMREIND